MGLGVREAFETAVMARRVANRTAGTRWNDPPEDVEDIVPRELWKDAVKLFPQPLQRKFQSPDEAEDRDVDGYSATLTTEVALSEDSGVSLSVRCVMSEDADEGGRYMHRAEDLDYTLWVARKDWNGSTVNQLRRDLQQFETWLKRHDPEGYAQFSG